jgi:CRP-like cAMP-binding protein
MASAKVRVTTANKDRQQEVIVNEPGNGEFFGFASMLEQTPHKTDAVVLRRRSVWKSLATTLRFCLR